MTSDRYKHMLSPSSLLKITGVLARNGGENGTMIIVVCRSWTWHFSTFVSGWEHLISFFTGFRGFGWSRFDVSSTYCLVTMTLIPWCQILPNPLSCRWYVQEKLTSAKLKTSLCYLAQSWFITYSLCLVSMMWETLWPTFDQGHFLSTSAHYPGSWSRDSLPVPWNLHASMVGSSCSMRGFHYWPPIGRFYGCSTSAHLFALRGLYL